MRLTNIATQTMSHATFATILRPDINVVSIPRPLAPRIREGLEQVAAESTFAHEAQLDTKAPDARSLLESVDDKALGNFLPGIPGSSHKSLALSWVAGISTRNFSSNGQMAVERSIRTTSRFACFVPMLDLVPNGFPKRTCAQMAWTFRRRYAHSKPSHLARRDRTRRCEPAEILLLKGEAHPGNMTHRSPPLGSSGLSRLVLKIDEARCGC